MAEDPSTSAPKSEGEDRGFVGFAGMQRVCKELKISSEDVYKKLETLKTPEDQLKYLFTLFDKVKFEGAYARGKNNTVAACLRKKGNILYGRGDTKNALNHYTMALSFATDDSPEMPLAIGNKSACFYDLDQPRAVSTHIKVIANSPVMCDLYPEKSMKKLFARLQNVKRKMIPVGHNERITEIVLENYLDGNSWEFQRSAEIINQPILDFSAMSTETFTGQRATIAYSSNTKAHNLSSAVKLEYSDQLGRHLVAARPINAGDVLVRSPMGAVSMYLETQEYSHCSNCLRFVSQLVPCGSCPDERYCDATCLYDAQVYHWALCRLGGELNFGGKVTHTKLMLALRLLFTHLSLYMGKMYDFVKEVSKYEAESAGNKFKGFNKKGIYDDRDFRSVYFMWSDPELLSVELRQSLALSAAYAMQVITENPDFFKTEKNLDKAKKTEMKLFLTRVLYRVLVGLEWNSYELFEHLNYVARQKNSQVKPFVVKSQVRPVGLFFNSLLSLFNHACYSNCIYSEQMNGIVLVRAIKTINEGEQLTIPYFDYFNTQKASKLTRYHRMGGFQCTCFACTHSLDSKKQLRLEDLPLSPVCEGCKERKAAGPGQDVVKCRKCKTSIKVARIRNTLVSHQVLMKYYKTQIPLTPITEFIPMLEYCDVIEEMALPNVCTEVIWLRRAVMNAIVAADKSYLRPVLISNAKSDEKSLLEEIAELPVHVFEED